jgi:pyruvate/2-oxoglutarate dehydrogenase complex dihydrolipoamide acyltransferase (E2) component
MPQMESAAAEANLHFAVKESDTYLERSNADSSVSGGLAVPVGGSAAGFLSPRVRARMNDLGLRDTDLAGVVGTGASGRVTAQDLERYLDAIASWPSVQASPMRMAVADAMRRSCSRPLATVGLPLPMDRILEHRSGQSSKPGITLYIVRALALTLAEDPSLAGNLVGNRIVLPKSIDLGVAVQIDDGVVVPVLRGVDRKSLRELVDEYDEAVSRARRRRLSEADTSGGIGTVTNFGGFGVTSGTPIPLPHETLILGLAAAVKKPVWSDQVEAFLPATVANLFLTFDHRVMDGIGAGKLMTRVSEWLATPAKL